MTRYAESTSRVSMWKKIESNLQAGIVAMRYARESPSGRKVATDVQAFLEAVENLDESHLAQLQDLMRRADVNGLKNWLERVKRVSGSHHAIPQGRLTIQSLGGQAAVATVPSPPAPVSQSVRRGTGFGKTTPVQGLNTSPIAGALAWTLKLPRMPASIQAVCNGASGKVVEFVTSTFATVRRMWKACRVSGRHPFNNVYIRVPSIIALFLTPVILSYLILAALAPPSLAPRTVVRRIGSWSGQHVLPLYDRASRAVHESWTAVVDSGMGQVSLRVIPTLEDDLASMQLKAGNVLRGRDVWTAEDTKTVRDHMQAVRELGGQIAPMLPNVEAPGDAKRAVPPLGSAARLVFTAGRRLPLPATSFEMQEKMARDEEVAALRDELATFRKTLEQIKAVIEADIESRNALKQIQKVMETGAKNLKALEQIKKIVETGAGNHEALEQIKKIMGMGAGNREILEEIMKMLREAQQDQDTMFRRARSLGVLEGALMVIAGSVFVASVTFVATSGGFAAFANAVGLTWFAGQIGNLMSVGCLGLFHWWSRAEAVATD